MERDKLWTINKKMIDPVCARHTALLKGQHVLLSLTNGSEDKFIRILPRHKKYEGAGNNNTTLTNRIWCISHQHRSGSHSDGLGKHHH
jgi:glutamyl-tRNA synthetase